MEVGIKLKTAFATTELGLGLTVTPVGVAALVAPLRGVPGVYSDDLAAASFSLILKESLELGKAPGMEPSFSFPTRGFDATPYVGEVFHDDSRTGLNAIKNRSSQDVVAIPSEALFTPSEASKVPFGRLSTFGLQCTSEAEYSLDNFFHMLVAMEPIVRSDGRSGNSQVDADSLSITGKGNIRQSDDNMEKEMTFTIKKVGGSCRIAYRILRIFWKVKRYFGSTLGGGQVNDTILPVYPEGMQVVPGWTGYRLRTTYLAPLLHSGDCRPHGFAGFLSGLYMQVRDERGLRILASAISQAMKSVSVTCSLLPACTADGVKRLGKLLNRLIKSFRLFWGGLELYPNRPIHVFIIPYVSKYLQVKSKKEVSADSSAS